VQFNHVKIIKNLKNEPPREPQCAPELGHEGEPGEQRARHRVVGEQAKGVKVGREVVRRVHAPHVVEQVLLEEALVVEGGAHRQQECEDQGGHLRVIFKRVKKCLKNLEI
jgi:hypothetical protein